MSKSEPLERTPFEHGKFSKILVVCWLHPHPDGGGGSDGTPKVQMFAEGLGCTARNLVETHVY